MRLWRLALCALITALCVTACGPAADITVSPDIRAGSDTVFSSQLLAQYADPASFPDPQYEWDFGDGSPKATGPQAHHTYAQPGQYQVTLHITDDAARANGQDYQTVKTVTVLPGITLIQDTRFLPIFNAGGYPAKGVSETDPLTGFAVTRVADKAELEGDYGNHASAMSTIVYSRYTPSNTTGELVLVHGDNSTSAWVYRVVDNKMLTVLKLQPTAKDKASMRSLGEINELRWDYSGAHPYRLYFVGRGLPKSQAVGGENPVMSFYYTDIDPDTGTQATPVLVHDFSPDFANHGSAGLEIMNDVEGDSSNDSRYWAWQVMDTAVASGPYLPVAIFSYDAKTNSVMGSLQRSCAGARVECTVIDTPATAAPHITRPNMVEFSPAGTRVVVDWARAYTGSNDADIGLLSDGPKAFAPNFTDPIRIGADATHSGWAWGPKGEEMFVSQNNRNDWIEAVDIASSATAHCQVISGNSYSCGVKIYPYAALDGGSWSLGMHFGKVYDKARKGWAYMNTYDGNNSSWGKNQNLLIELNAYPARASKIVRLGSSYNAYHDYRSEGSGALDFKGDTIWGTANWGITDGRGDVFRVSLPAAWFSSIK
jgi:PKD repeat protein